MLTMAIARRLPRPRSTALRLAIANIHRPGALTPSVVLSLGLGLCAARHRRRDRRQPASPVRRGAAGAGAVVFLHRHSVAPTPDASTPSSTTTRRARMLRTGADAARPHRRRQRRQGGGSQAGRRLGLGAARRPRHHLSPQLPPGSRLVAGEWWPADYSGPPLVSLEGKTADGLGLKLGDTVTVNVLGRNVTARIANLRAVDWQSLGINFVLVFSPGAFAGAPHTDIATLTFADGGTAAEETALIKARPARSRQSRPCASRTRSMRSTASSAISCWRCAAPARMTLIAAALVLAARSRPASVFASTTPSCSRHWVRRAPGSSPPTPRISAASASRPCCSASCRLRRGVASSSRG